LSGGLQHQATIIWPPRKYQLVAALLANSLLLSSKIMAMLIAYLKRSTLRWKSADCFLCKM